MSLFNLGQTDGDSVCGDCINISNPDERGGFGGRTDEPLQKGRARKEETKEDGQKLGAHWFFSLPPLIRSLSLSPWLFFPFVAAPFPRSIAKDGCRLMESSHVVERTGGLTGERAEGERQDSTSPLTEH